MPKFIFPTEDLSTSGIRSFVSSILFLVVVPALPIIFEWMYTGQVSNISKLITLTVLVVTTAATSEDFFEFLTAIIWAFINSGVYGLVALNKDAGNWLTISLYGSGIILLVHYIERFNRHIIKKQRFWEFNNVSF